MTTQEKLEDVEIALHISQVDGNKWKARAIKLAKFLGIRDCDIDDFDLNNATNGDVIKALLGKENVYIDKFSEEVNIYKNQVYIATIKRYWWDAPYKAESEEI